MEGQGRVPFQIKPKGSPKGAVVGAAGQLYVATTLVALSVAWLCVSKVSPALVGGPAGVLFHGVEVGTFVRTLRHKLSQFVPPHTRTARSTDKGALTGALGPREDAPHTVSRRGPNQGHRGNKKQGDFHDARYVRNTKR